MRCADKERAMSAEATMIPTTITSPTIAKHATRALTMFYAADAARWAERDDVPSRDAAMFIWWRDAAWCLLRRVAPQKSAMRPIKWHDDIYEPITPQERKTWRDTTTWYDMRERRLRRWRVAFTLIRASDATRRHADDMSLFDAESWWCHVPMTQRHEITLICRDERWWWHAVTPMPMMPPPRVDTPLRKDITFTSDATIRATMSDERFMPVYVIRVVWVIREPQRCHTRYLRKMSYATMPFTFAATMFMPRATQTFTRAIIIRRDTREMTYYAPMPAITTKRWLWHDDDITTISTWHYYLPLVYYCATTLSRYVVSLSRRLSMAIIYAWLRHVYTPCSRIVFIYFISTLTHCLLIVYAITVCLFVCWFTISRYHHFNCLSSLHITYILHHARFGCRHYDMPSLRHDAPMTLLLRARCLRARVPRCALMMMSDDAIWVIDETLMSRKHYEDAERHDAEMCRWVEMLLSFIVTFVTRDAHAPIHERHERATMPRHHLLRHLRHETMRATSATMMTMRDSYAERRRCYERWKDASAERRWAMRAIAAMQREERVWAIRRYAATCRDAAPMMFTMRCRVAMRCLLHDAIMPRWAQTWARCWWWRASLCRWWCWKSAMRR